MEKILVSGDSWSNPKYKSRPRPEYKQTITWTDLLKGDVTNISINGLDNISIINNALWTIYENKPNRVIIALSCWSRYYTPNYRMNPLFLYKNAARRARNNFNGFKYDIVEYERQVKHLAGTMDIELDEDSVYKFLEHFIKNRIPRFVADTSLALMNIINICDHLKIKLHIFQSFTPFSCHENLKIARAFERELITSDLFLDLWDTNADLIGYPWITGAGGFTADDALIRREDLIGNGDGHPNQVGHRKIGEWFNASYTDYEI